MGHSHGLGYAMEDNHFEVLIIGTGLTESITAAALSKAGFKVAHVDSNPFYGGDAASLSHDELLTWLQAQSSGSNVKYSSVTWSKDLVQQSRQYAICLRPSLIPSIGPLISALISSGVSRYGGFRLVETVGIYHASQAVKNVPGTKEDVFKTKEISLIDKRRLMRFLLVAVGDPENDTQFKEPTDLPFSDFLKTKYSLGDEIVSVITHALAFCATGSEPTSKVLPRLRRYLRSSGRYGASPYLIGHYGGTGEIVQGFCRAAAVSGGVYILGRQLQSIKGDSSQGEKPQTANRRRYEILLEDFPEKLTADVVVTSASQRIRLDGDDIQPSLPTSLVEDNTISIARCIAIIDQPIILSETSPAKAEVADENEGTSGEIISPPQKPLDAGVIVFPPSTVHGGSTSSAATLLVTGEGTMSTPAGKWILYIAVPVEKNALAMSAEEVVKPYLDATLALTRSFSSQSSPPPSEAPVSNADIMHMLLFSAFYFEHADRSAAISESPRNVTARDQSPEKTETFIVSPALPPALALPEYPDVSAIYAEAVFWDVVNALKAMDTKDTSDGSSAALSVENFWPPLEQSVDSDGEDGW